MRTYTTADISTAADHAPHIYLAMVLMLDILPCATLPEFSLALGNLGGCGFLDSVLSRDTLTTGQEESGLKPPTLESMDNHSNN